VRPGGSRIVRHWADETAIEIARHGLIIETGRVSKSGTTATLADDPAIRQAYLGM
jgi:ABC-type branched-subunit amino acid transport system ATPase component